MNVVLNKAKWFFSNLYLCVAVLAHQISRYKSSSNTFIQKYSFLMWLMELKVCIFIISTLQQKWFHYQRLVIMQNHRAFVGSEQSMTNLKMLLLHSLLEWMTALSCHSNSNLLEYVDGCDFFWFDHACTSCVQCGVHIFNKVWLFIPKKKKKIFWIIEMSVYLGQGNDHHICFSWTDISLCRWNPTIQVLSSKFAFNSRTWI